MASPERVYKVVLFGVTGCGKSSIVNLLADKSVADVSTGAEACTRRARSYPISLDRKKFRLWDTMGFNQSETSDINPLSPYEQAHALLRDLQDGVDLILLCARKDGINASLRNLYWLLDSFFFGGRAQIALVLTHFDVPDDRWWGRKRNIIAQRRNIPVRFLPYACITTTQNGLPQSDPLYNQSKQALRALLQEYGTASTPTPLSLDLSSDTTIATAVKGLHVHCQLSIPDATTLVENFRLPRRPFRVILFGESGAGKSSVINLLVGDSVAEVSPGKNSCTLDYHGYEINIGMHQFVVWDTVGLNGHYVEHSTCGQAIENAVRLIRDLYHQGGIDLLVFCKKSGRLPASELNNLWLFHEFLCDGQVPVAFIITHLEHQDPMEKWWEENGDGLMRACDLRGGAVAGHACITSLRLDDSHDQRLHNKLVLSRHIVQTMLEDSISYGSGFRKYEELWIMSFLRKLAGMVKVGHLSRREKLTVKSIMNRCGLTKEQAEELIRLLYESQSQPVDQFLRPSAVGPDDPFLRPLGSGTSTCTTPKYEMSSPIFALIIAIDKYKSHNYHNLTGCKDDGARFIQFLTDVFGVPSSHIVYLADEQATRAMILNQFDQFLVKNKDINRDDPIVLFFAGYGSQVDAPIGWLTDDNKIEILRTHDSWTIGDDGKEIWGISDRAIDALLRTLAIEKGDNIVVILDRCYSRNPTENKEQSDLRVRPISPPLYPPLADLDYDVWSSAPKLCVNAAIQDVFQYNPIFLSACHLGESVFEDPSAKDTQGGLFTAALIGCLYRSDLRNTSYAGIGSETCRTVPSVRR